jgi:hypothetical protein
MPHSSTKVPSTLDATRERGRQFTIESLCVFLHPAVKHSTQSDAVLYSVPCGVTSLLCFDTCGGGVYGSTRYNKYEDSIFVKRPSIRHASRPTCSVRTEERFMRVGARTTNTSLYSNAYSILGPVLSKGNQPFSSFAPTLGRQLFNPSQSSSFSHAESSHIKMHLQRLKPEQDPPAVRSGTQEPLTFDAGFFESSHWCHHLSSLVHT